MMLVMPAARWHSVVRSRDGAEQIDLWRRSADVGALKMRFGQMAGFDRMASLKLGIRTALNIVARRIPA